MRHPFRGQFLAIMAICLLSIVTQGCQSKKSPSHDSESKGVRLIDDGPPLSQISRILPIGRDSLIIVDRAHQIQLFIGYHYRSSIGAKGKGPQEYSTVTDLSVSGDTVFIFDQSLGKVAEYSLSDNAFLHETVSMDLTKCSGFVRGDGVSYFCVTQYGATTSPSTPLLYRQNAYGSLDPLNLCFGDLKSNAFFTLSNYPRIKYSGGILYTAFPFTNSIWLYDTRTDRPSSFPLGFDYPEQLKDGEVVGFEEKAKTMERIEQPSRFVLLRDCIAVMGVRMRFGALQPSDETVKVRIRYFSYSGKLVRECKARVFTFGIEDSAFVRYSIDTTATNEGHPYLIFRETCNFEGS